MKQMLDHACWLTQQPPSPDGLPLFRREFELKTVPKTVFCQICGLGYFVLYVNGKRVGDAVLEPSRTCYDVRTLYCEYDVTDLLKTGKNECEIHLGNGYYGLLAEFSDAWGNERAAWRDLPKTAMVLLDPSGNILLRTDRAWQTSAGAVVSDAPRCGTKYDARREKVRHYMRPVIAPPPGGRLECAAFPPIRVVRTLDPLAERKLPDGASVFDFGENLTGRARICCSGPAGSKLKLVYSELVHPESGDTDQSNIDIYTRQGEFQTDTYILGGEDRKWYEPEFSCHGFRYVKAVCSPDVRLHGIQARRLRTGFLENGHFECSHEDLNNLFKIVRRSIECNFAGFPSDCPHREQLGWTADAHLAAESALTLFQAGDVLEEYLEKLCDRQRPSGQIPGIAPAQAFGWSWNYGPLWESALVLIPWYIFQRTGNSAAVKRFYSSCKKYLAYCERCMACGDLIDYGPGDWLAPEGRSVMSPEYSASVYYLNNCNLMAKFAVLCGFEPDAAHYGELAGRVRSALRTKFRRAGGSYDDGGMAAAALALNYGVAETSEKPALAALLRRQALAAGFKADFGFFGAYHVPKALAAHGFLDSALQFFLQKEYPGWQYMIDRGATTLWENWNGSASQNHQAFGGYCAWAMEFLAGIRLEPERAVIVPCFTELVSFVRAAQHFHGGEIRIEWHRTGSGVKLEATLSKPLNAFLQIPGQKEPVPLGEGKNTFVIPVRSFQPR